MPGDGTVGTAAVRLYPFDAPSEHTGPAAPPKAKKQRAEPQPKQIGGARVFFREGASGAVFSVAAPADACAGVPFGVQHAALGQLVKVAVLPSGYRGNARPGTVFQGVCIGSLREDDLYQSSPVATPPAQAAAQPAAHAGASAAQEEPDDDTACAVCHNTGDGGVMILCDGDGEGGECKFAIHTYCCKPKLDKVPEGAWFCPACRSKPAAAAAAAKALPPSAREPGPAAKARPRAGRPAAAAGRPAKQPREAGGAGGAGGSSRKAVRAPDAGPAEHESTTSPEAAPRCLVCCSPGSLEHMVRCTACELVAHPYCAPGNPQRGSSEPYFCPGCLACSAAADGMQARGAAHDADTPLKRMNAQLFDDTHLGMTPSHGMGAGPHLASAFLAELEQQGGAHGHGRPAGADDGLFSPSSLLS